MNTNHIETIPETWDDSRDVTFFSITSRLFSAEFAYGAGVLLATYDVDDENTSTADVAVSGATSDTATTSTSSTSETVFHSQPWSAS